jgi:hypothetical protein
LWYYGDMHMLYVCGGITMTVRKNQKDHLKTLCREAKETQCPVLKDHVRKLRREWKRDQAERQAA